MFNYKTIKVTSFHDPSGSCNFCFHDPSGLVYWNLAERRLGQRGNDRGRERETEREGEKEGERKRQTEGGSERERERETVSSYEPWSADSLLRHSQTPVRTSEFINAFNASGTVQSSDYPDKALLQIHGQSHNTAIHDYRLCLYRYTNVNFMASIGFDCHLLCIMDEASTPQWGVVPGTLNWYLPYTCTFDFHSYTDSSCSAGYLSLHNRGWFYLCLCGTGYERNTWSHQL